MSIVTATVAASPPALGRARWAGGRTSSMNACPIFWSRGSALKSFTSMPRLAALRLARRGAMIPSIAARKVSASVSGIVNAPRVVPSPRRLMLSRVASQAFSSSRRTCSPSIWSAPSGSMTSITRLANRLRSSRLCSPASRIRWASASRRGSSSTQSGSASIAFMITEACAGRDLTCQPCAVGGLRWWRRSSRAIATRLDASPLVMPVRLASHAVVEVAPSSLGSPIPSAQPASSDITASRAVRVRWTALATSRTSAPVRAQASSAAASSARDDSCSRIMEAPKRH